MRIHHKWMEIHNDRVRWEIHTPKRCFSSLFSRFSSLQVCNHFMRDRLVARSFKTCPSSCRLYWPTFKVCRRKWVCMILVKASASCAALWTHLTFTPSAIMSLIALACNWVLNSWHCGGAVRVIKSNKDLQSVTAIDGSSLLQLWMLMVIL